jgi:hypothetical protein
VNPIPPQKENPWDHVSQRSQNVTLEPKSDLDRLVHDKLGQGFKLCLTTAPSGYSKESAAWKMVTDGLLSSDPRALAFTILMNSILTHRRIFFVLLDEEFTRLIRHDEGVKALPRRLRDKVKVVQYAEFRALMHRSGYFQEVSKVVTQNGFEISIFQVIEPKLLAQLKTASDPQEQLKEIEDFYQRSREKMARKMELKKLDQETAARRNKKREQGNAEQPA